MVFRVRAGVRGRNRVFILPTADGLRGLRSRRISGGRSDIVSVRAKQYMPRTGQWTTPLYTDRQEMVVFVAVASGVSSESPLCPLAKQGRGQ